MLMWVFCLFVGWFLGVYVWCVCECVFGVSVGVCEFGVCVWLSKALPWNFPRISGGLLSDFP